MRPKKEMDQKQFEALLRLNPTLKDTAAFFKVSEDTIYRRAQEWGYESFADAKHKNMVHTRLDLVREAVKQATKKGNNTMLIFCLKNLCGWSDSGSKVEELEQKINIILDGQGANNGKSSDGSIDQEVTLSEL